MSIRVSFFLSSLLCVLTVPAIAQEQSSSQQACINALNRGFAKVAKAQRKEIARCIKRAAKGKLTGQTIETCNTADERQKVAKAQQKLLDQEAKKCGQAPDFAYAGASVVQQQATAAELSTIHELFGTDLDAAIVDSGSSKTEATCQQAVVKLSGKCQDAVNKEFNKCAKSVLKLGAADAIAVLACDGADSGLKVAKACDTKLAEGIAAKCSGQDLDALVPGCAGQDLATCAAAKVRARAGVALDAAGDLTPIRVLLYSRTAGFRHPSIADAHVLFGNLPAEQGIRAFVTEDPLTFSDVGLAPFDVMLFANTTGDVLDESQQAAMQAFIRSGRGYVGAHSAADTEHAWPWYGQLVGGYFRSHPVLPVEVEVSTENGDHPSTDHLPSTFVFTDEIYNFDRNPRIDSQILLTVDEAGFIYPNLPSGPSMGEDHPIAWHREFEGARSFYTNLGHRPETWDDPLFQEHLLDGIRWVAEGVSYSRIVVTEQASNPMALAVTPDGDVYYIERTGEVLFWNHLTGQVSTAATLDVDTSAENGLLGIVLDPGFASNRRVYLYHSEPVPEPPPATGPPGENVLSQFTALADGTLDVASRVDLLRVPSDRECCHEGGGMAFGVDGTLFVTTGDNTNPHAANGFTPIDERSGRDLFNAQRTASNPFDLRGKILRINSDGTIPSGNLFPTDGLSGRPEIYTMGCRNPFRIAIDPLTGRVFWGEVGPDAFNDGARGPRGYDEINVADAPGNYGWPYCIADNLPYADYDFDTATVGPLFDCSATVPATLFYDYLTLSEFVLGTALNNSEGSFPFTGRTAIAGAFYRAPGFPARFALPPPFADTLLMAEWTRDLLVSVEVDESGALQRLVRLVPWERFVRPIDIEVGPDGAVYVLEFGSAFFGDNPDARLSRIEHSATGELNPVAVVNSAPVDGVANAFEFSGERSHVPGRDESIVSYNWDFDGDGVIDATGAKVQHTFATTGLFQVTLTIVTDQERSSIPIVEPIVIGNTPAEVTIISPADGTTVPSGTPVLVTASADDAEDGLVACEDLEWRLRLGHNAHSHPVGIPATGCTFSFDPTLSAHGDGLGLFWAVEVAVTDQGGPGGEPALTGRAGIRIDVEP